MCKFDFTTFLLCAFTLSAAQAQTFTNLAYFNSTNGSGPLGALVQGVDGNLYGTTASGGSYSYGTVFKITTSGALTTLHSFCSQANCSDGSDPAAGPVQATDGNLYGTTYGGGNGKCGTVFRITLEGALTPLHEFYNTDGCNPDAGVVEAVGGEFYGTAEFGGTSNCCGAVFKISRGGSLTTLHSFNGVDGFEPLAAVVRAIDGNFYGTTLAGGPTSNAGTVFRITPEGKLTTIYSFGSTGPTGPDGLIQAPDGNFYGVSQYGGAYGGGTVFRLTPAGVLTTLYSFSAVYNGTDLPNNLVQGTDGNFYGTTYFGGANGFGTVFKITPGGMLTTLHNFDGTNGSRNPGGALVQATDGNFYGTTFGEGDGPAQSGTVFKLSVGLGPFVKLLLPSGKVGDAVQILGTNLTGADYMSFNGTQASFTVLSPTLIATTVPIGATSGKVHVNTPGGTLFSGGPFVVRP
jgi:uncharacterized repeat protein (TIGR03803 family)